MRGCSTETDAPPCASPRPRHSRPGPDAPRRTAKLPEDNQTHGETQRGDGHHRPRNRFATGAAHRYRPRLPLLESPIGHAIRWRVAAHPTFITDRIRVDGNALCIG